LARWPVDAATCEPRFEDWWLGRVGLPPATLVRHDVILMTPAKQVRAVFDDQTITVYQAYAPAIAVPAARQGSFAGTPFKVDRMTWIKPSFLWMMYRSGWATKPGQEHILAIQVARAGFEEALSLACISHFDPGVYPNHDAWKRAKEISPVRVQWDPERTAALAPLPWRSLQVGLGGPTVRKYVDEWVTGITDITASVRDLQHLASEELSGLPAERPYPLPPEIRSSIGADF
jgi:hypothetical protein